MSDGETVQVDTAIEVKIGESLDEAMMRAGKLGAVGVRMPAGSHFDGRRRVSPIRSSVYVASSWRNPTQPVVVQALRAAGHDVYDFRNPAEGDHGFSWKQCLPGWMDGQPFTAAALRSTLQHPIAQRGFQLDFGGMKSSDTCVLVLPCGRSAHLEAGWLCGTGRRLIVLSEQPLEPELMYLLGGGVIVSSIDEVLVELARPVAHPELVSMADLEKQHIRRVLDLVQGNKSKAARVLGFDRRTLYRKLERIEKAERAAKENG